MRKSKFFLSILTLPFFAAPSLASNLESIVAVQQIQIQKLMDENKLLRKDFEEHKKSLKGLKVMQFTHAWGYSRYPSESASPFVQLPFSINGGGSGGNYILMCSLNASIGDATRSSVHLVRAGYDGNHYSMETIAGKESPVIYAHRARSDGILEVQTYGGNTNCLILSNKG